MTQLKLAGRLLWRDGRSGELSLLMLALLIAVASSTTISLFVDRLQRSLSLQAADFLAGDMVISGPAAVDASWLKQAKDLELSLSQTVEFGSVLLENQQMLLASVKAVSSAYPLRGFLKSRGQADAEEQINHAGPEPGTVWVESRVLSALNMHLGDMLTVGEKPLRIDRQLSYETDKRGDFYSFSPRVMMHQADLAATGVIQPGSRARYFYQFSGPEAQLAAFKQAIKPLLNPSQRLLDVYQDRPELGAAVSRAERYLGLSGIVVVLIAGVAIAMAASRYSERHFNTTALLRCLGCRQKQIVRLYAYQLLMVGALASAAGCLLGWFGQQALFELLKDLLPERLVNPGPRAIFSGFVTGMVILFAFAVPPMWRLRNVAPLRVLRRDLQPVPLKAWLSYGLAMLLLAGLAWRYSPAWQTTAAVVGVGGGLLLILLWLLNALLRLGAVYLSRFNVTWRFGVQGLIRNRRASVSQILAFAVTLVAMTLSFSVRNELIEQWRRQLPERAPNHFVLNILPEQRQAFEAELRQNDVAASRMYPIVRGRLVAINEQPVQQRVSKESRGEEATRRDLSLTWAETLPEDNRITVGEPWQADLADQVSVEQKLADNLGISVGDRLTFSIGSSQIQATVANLRTLDWDTMRPNFYMIFSPGTLEAFPQTYLTSFYLPEEQKDLLNRLVKAYPAITVLEVDQILKQVNAILQQLTQATNVLLSFALLAGFLVLFAAVYASQDQREHEAAVVRTLGAKRSWLRKMHLIEFGLLGILAGLLAAVISEAILYVLYSRIMHMPFQPAVWIWLGLPALGGSAIAVAGYWGVRAVVNRSPMRVLRRL